MRRRKGPTNTARQPKSNHGVSIQLVSNRWLGSQSSVPNFSTRILPPAILPFSLFFPQPSLSNILLLSLSPKNGSNVKAKIERRTSNVERRTSTLKPQTYLRPGDCLPSTFDFSTLASSQQPDLRPIRSLLSAFLSLCSVMRPHSRRLRRSSRVAVLSLRIFRNTS